MTMNWFSRPLSRSAKPKEPVQPDALFTCHAKQCQAWLYRNGYSMPQRANGYWWIIPAGEFIPVPLDEVLLTAATAGNESASWLLQTQGWKAYPLFDGWEELNVS